ncbi:hypothetical protein DR950_36045 [Kitasatospora xanthocidica]|uniref:Uncharacterized protein n=2 Tax=Kitasatospora xanthocidica TaxID=83382 RepID=A0A373A307_9ACTN|nr:hypothetical protein DR950_36045 [Kitasatospora xanthocidica]
MRNLQKPNEDTGDPWSPVAESFTKTFEGFVGDAKRWLREKSDLSTRTIENADYEVAYLWFIHGKNKEEEMGTVGVRVGKRLWEYFEGTGLLQEGGEEDPKIYGELMALRTNGGGRIGRVGQDTLGWMLDYAESFADVAEDRYDSKAAEDFLSGHSSLFTGQIVAVGKLAADRVPEEDEAPQGKDANMELLSQPQLAKEAMDRSMGGESLEQIADDWNEQDVRMAVKPPHGKPIHHVKTGKLVGWWTPKAFVPVESVSDASEG